MGVDVPETPPRKTDGNLVCVFVKKQTWFLVFKNCVQWPDLAGDLDELLDDPHPLGGVRLADNLADGPHHFPVDQFAEEGEAGGPVSGPQLKEVVNVLGGLDLSEGGEILHHQLGRNFHRVQLKWKCNSREITEEPTTSNSNLVRSASKMYFLFLQL